MGEDSGDEHEGRILGRSTSRRGCGCGEVRRDDVGDLYLGCALLVELERDGLNGGGLATGSTSVNGGGGERPSLRVDGGEEELEEGG
jgi:hypothetical protein